MWDKLENVFDTLGYPYSRQGGYSEEDELPESFFTYWNLDTPEKGFYDNDNNEYCWFWVVYFYTKNAKLLYNEFNEFVKIAKKIGFKVDGKGKDIPSDVPNYLGRYIKLTYMEEKS